MTTIFNARTHFSIGESLMKPDELVSQASEKGANAVVLSDTMTVCGLPQFMQEASKKGVTPIIGVRLRIVDELFKDKAGKKKFRPYHLRAIALTEKGYNAIVELLSLSFDDDHFYGVPRLLLTDVTEAFSRVSKSDVILTLGDTYSAVSHSKCDEIADALVAAGIRVALDMVVSTLPYYVRNAHEVMRLHKKYGFEVFPQHPASYSDGSKAESFDIMRTIAANMPLSDLSSRDQTKDWVLKPVSEFGPDMAKMAKAAAERFGGDPVDTMNVMKAGLTAIMKIPEEAKFRWEKQEPSLPKMAEDHFAALKMKCAEGWKNRLGVETFGYKPADLSEYKERLMYELKILHDKKFEAYFLLVSEIVNWSKENGIRVGPGRGSVGGSLVAYLMGITDVDPIRFGLLFERFINPSRPDLPDADLDFMSSRREEVIDWIRKHFGEEYVAGVSNYTKIAGAGSLSDVSKKLGLPDVPAFGSWIEKEHGQTKSLQESLETSPQLAQFAKQHPEAMRHAQVLEGTMRSYGKHAAGIIVAGVPLKERAVVEKRSGSSVVCWDKRFCEEFGLVKLDILGLANLDTIDIAVKLIQKSRGVKVDVSKIPLDDPKVLAEFGQGNTIGVFQFASSLMRGILKDMATTTALKFDDLSAATALGRPGPMDSGLLDQFLKIKKGEATPVYLHPSMKPALEDTYGVFVYQESVMRVSRDFAGFSGVEAEKLRKAMGKKDKELMAKMQEQFVKGAVALHGVTEGFAKEVFTIIEGFAGYGFNKSHSVAYTLISYICMYLKVYYPAEYFCGVLTVEKVDKRAPILKDMERHGISLKMPDINLSEASFAPYDEKTIICPFASIKGISDNTQTAIISARADGKFTSLEDFLSRVEKRKCNKGHMDKLDRVGALASIRPGTPVSSDPCRLRDQIDLMQGLIADSVVIDRDIKITVESAHALIRAQEEMRSHIFEGQNVADSRPAPSLENHPRFVIVVDSPSREEESYDKMGCGKGMDAIHAALERQGLSINDVYITALYKSVKPKGGFDNSYKSEVTQFVDREMDILRPPLIVAMGGESAKHFAPEMAGTPTDNKGTVFYNADKDWNVMVGMNPNQIIYDDSKQADIDALMAKAVSLLRV